MQSQLPLPNVNRNWIGGDPECFLVDKRGYIGPIHRFENKIPTSFSKPIGHRDGAAFEFNIAPGLCRGNVMGGVQEQIKKIVAFAAQNELHMQMRAQGRILNEYLTDAPPDMMKGGCDPDYDAYSGLRKEPNRYANNFRYAGGHMHFGIDTQPSDHEKVEVYAGAVSLLDIFVGIPLVAIGGDMTAKEEAARRCYYGQAGSFRVQPHGFEYRTPSSFLYSAPEILSGLFGMARIVINSYFNNIDERVGTSLDSMRKANANLRILDEMTVRHIIDMVDVREAQRFCLEELFPRIGYLDRGISQSYTRDYSTIATGLAALTYGATQGHYLSRNVVSNWQSSRGPAIALSQYDHWPWYKYVRELVPNWFEPSRGSIAYGYQLCPTSCKTCKGLGFPTHKGDVY